MSAAPTTSTTVDVEGKDVVRLVVQFLKESGLTVSARALQSESGVSPNSVDSAESFAADIIHGRWDVVLETTTSLQLPAVVLVDLYELVVLELAETQERETARSLLRQSRPMAVLRDSDPERYQRLEKVAASAGASAVGLVAEYLAGMGTNRERRRSEVARALSSTVAVSRPSRLLELLGEAIRYEQEHNLANRPGSRIDLLRGVVAVGFGDGGLSDSVPAKALHTIGLGKESHFECARFSPDGRWLVTGSSDGFAELWDPTTGTLDTARLKYQADEELLMHDASVLCAAFSSDGEYLVTGSQDGCVKVWEVLSGKCTRKIDCAHEKGVTCVAFGDASATVYTGSFDCTARAHGVKSGRTLRVFRGHTSFVNDVCLVRNGAQLATASSDGTVRIWDSRSALCVATIDPSALASSQTARASGGSPVHSAQSFSLIPDSLLVCTRGGAAYVVTTSGKLVRQFNVATSVGSSSSGSSPSKALLASTGALQAAAMAAEASATASVDLVGCVTTARGKWVMCGSEDGQLHCFDASTGKYDHSVKLHDKGLIGTAHHPKCNVFVSWSEDGTLKIWTP